MCRNCTIHAMSKRDPKELLGAVEVKTQMDELESTKNLLTSKLKEVNKKIETIREWCSHVHTKTYGGYDEDTEECLDCGYSW